MTRDPGFRVYWGRRWAALIASVGGVMSGTGALMAWRAWPDNPLGAALALGFAGLMALVLAKGLKLLVNPALMFEFNAGGLFVYYRGNDYGHAPYHLTWDQVEAIELVKRRAAGGDNLYARTLAVRVRPGLHVPEERSTGGSGDPRVLHLDATSGTPSGEQLLALAQAAWRHYG